MWFFCVISVIKKAKNHYYVLKGLLNNETCILVQVLGFKGTLTERKLTFLFILSIICKVVIFLKLNCLI